ncbi:hypothetical protein TKK_0001326 [Trichogramma kaykai]
MVNVDENGCKVGNHVDQVKLETLERMRSKISWDREKSRYKFLRSMKCFFENWKIGLPDLREVFQRKQIVKLLMDSIDCRGLEFIGFVIRTGYKDEPEVDEGGKPLLRCFTPVYHAFYKRRGFLVPMLFKIYDSFDVNYVDESGLTHFHAACQYGCDDIVEKFLELGQDPDIPWTETPNPPLICALDNGHKNVTELLLRRGADPNQDNANGETTLHVICSKDDNDEFAEEFFKICDDIQQKVLIDAVDYEGITPLQYALAYGKTTLRDFLSV